MHVPLPLPDVVNRRLEVGLVECGGFWRFWQFCRFRQNVSNHLSRDIHLCRDLLLRMTSHPQVENTLVAFRYLNPPRPAMLSVSGGGGGWSISALFVFGPD